MEPLSVTLKLSEIVCHDEADGIGNAEPYLWTIFFKIDGETIKQNGVSLTGDAVFYFGTGSHENLNTHAVDSGETVTIPASVGEWHTTLTPIEIKDFSNNSQLIPAITGVAVILMEEDLVSDDGAKAGHTSLNNFVRDSINNFLHGISLLDFVGVEHPQEKLNELITALTKTIKDEASGKVATAIKNQQPWYNNAWAFINADDNIGSEIFVFTQSDIVHNNYGVSLNKRWQNEGDWEIFGNISAPNPCNSFVILVNQQKNKIRAVNNQMSNLRATLGRKSPAERKIILAEIYELSQSLIPMQTELQRLTNLLNRCYINQSIHSTHVSGNMITVLE